MKESLKKMIKFNTVANVRIVLSPEMKCELEGNPTINKKANQNLVEAVNKLQSRIYPYFASPIGMYDYVIFDLEPAKNVPTVDIIFEELDGLYSTVKGRDYTSVNAGDDIHPQYIDAFNFGIRAIGYSGEFPEELRKRGFGKNRVVNLCTKKNLELLIESDEMRQAKKAEELP